MSEFIDTHCHIQSAGGGNGERTTAKLWAKTPGIDPDVIIKNAQEVGVSKLLCVGCDVTDSQLAVDFVQGRDGCWASIGIHPHETKDYAGNKVELQKFEELATQPKVVAVGECGLDYYYNHSPKAEQQKMLRYQIELALENDLPIIFHVREAFDDFWPIFESYEGIRGVLHSFTDSAANMKKGIDAGLYIGVNGIATFAKDSEQLAVYKSIPLDRLLLETDAPFLTPVPHRGKTNEPQYIPNIAAFLAELREENVQTLADATTKNAEQLFGGIV